jgi:uncharacterized membrane protein
MPRLSSIARGLAPEPIQPTLAIALALAPRNIRAEAVIVPVLALLLVAACTETTGTSAGNLPISSPATHQPVGALSPGYLEVWPGGPLLPDNQTSRHFAADFVRWRATWSRQAPRVAPTFAMVQAAAVASFGDRRWPYDINSSGVVTGMDYSVGSAPVLWPAGSTTAVPLAFPTPPAGLSNLGTAAIAINDGGQVAGYMYASDPMLGRGGRWIVRWDAGTPVLLPQVDGSDVAVGIAADGSILGYTFDGPEAIRVWREGSVETIGSGHPFAISPNGEYVVAALEGVGPSRWRRGIGWTTLAAPAGHPTVFARDVTDDGTVVGGAIDPTRSVNSTVPVLWAPDGTPTALVLPADALFGYAIAVRGDGTVLATHGISQPPYMRASLWRGGDWSTLPVPSLPATQWYFQFGALAEHGDEAVGVWENFDVLNVVRGVRWSFSFADAGATPTGSGITVEPEDGNGATPVALTFSMVTGGGTTTVASSSQGSPPPTGFRLGQPPRYYELTTTASYTGPVTVCILYEPAEFSRPALLRLFHDDGSGWADVTTSNDVTGRICGMVTTLSPFALFESRYMLSGLQAPVDNPPTVNTVRAGSGVPVKFSLGGNWGLDVLARGFPRTASTTCDVLAPSDPIEQTVTAGQSQLQYDPVAGSYTYVWKTDKTWAGYCRILTLRFVDGQELAAKFKFTR